MKLAFLIGLSADKRTAFPLSAEALPFDTALKQFKDMNAARQGPAPHVQLWTEKGVVKSARFEKVVKPLPPVETEAPAPVEVAPEVEVPAEIDVPAEIEVSAEAEAPVETEAAAEPPKSKRTK